MNQPVLDAVCSDAKPTRSILCLLGMAMATLFGCDPGTPLPPDVQRQLVTEATSVSVQSEPTVETTNESPITKIELCSISQTEWIDQGMLPWNYSEVQYLGSTRIGFSSLSIEKSDLANLNQLKVRRVDVIDRDSDGSSIPPRRVVYESFERANGELLGFHFDSTVDGQSDLEIDGRVVFGELEISRRENGGKKQNQKLPWNNQNWGPIGIQQLLMRSPMKPEEKRSAAIFIPQMLQFVPVVLEAKQWELTPLVEKKPEQLLAIDVAIGTAESGVLSTLFVDSLGTIQKTVTRSGPPMLKLKVPEETVQRLNDQVVFARGISRQVTLVGSADELAGATLQLDVIADKDDPFDLILGYQRQHRRSITPTVCRVTLNGQADETSVEPSEMPGDNFKASSLMIPSDKEVIATLAQDLIGEKSVTEPAVALHSGLHSKWQALPVSEEISSTLIAARQLQGTSIEAANLLAALLRSQHIPARIAVGLRLVPDDNSAVFHAWAQAWYSDGWHDLDATLSNDQSVQHIAMHVSDGSGPNPYAHFLTALASLEKIQEIRIVTE